MSRSKYYLKYDEVGYLMGKYTWTTLLLSKKLCIILNQFEYDYINNIYFDKLFSNAKMFTKSLDTLCGILFSHMIHQKHVLCPKDFIFSTIVLSVEMGSSDKRPNILRGVDLSIFSG